MAFAMDSNTACSRMFTVLDQIGSCTFIVLCSCVMRLMHSGGQKTSFAVQSVVLYSGGNGKALQNGAQQAPSEGRGVSVAVGQPDEKEAEAIKRGLDKLGSSREATPAVESAGANTECRGDSDDDSAPLINMVQKIGAKKGRPVPGSTASRKRQRGDAKPPRPALAASAAAEMALAPHTKRPKKQQQPPAQPAEEHAAAAAEVAAVAPEAAASDAVAAAAVTSPSKKPGQKGAARSAAKPAAAVKLQTPPPVQPQKLPEGPEGEKWGTRSSTLKRCRPSRSATTLTRPSETSWRSKRSRPKLPSW